MMVSVMLLSMVQLSSLAATVDYTITNPYASVSAYLGKDANHYKTNLHAHSTYSDATEPLDVMVKGYYDQNYDILGMADHGVIGVEWDDVPNGDKAVVPCVIVDIKRKKDKRNNQFAYIDLCTNNGIVEATIWSRQLKEYAELIQKGSCISILGRKEDNHLFVERVKPYEAWLEKIKKIRSKANIYNY
jgi:DNA polymerase III alpha subunit